MRKIEKVSKVYGILRKFHTENDGILDGKGAADFVSLGDRVGAELAADDLARDEIAVKRHDRDVAFATVQRSVLECKRAVEIVVIRDGRGVKVPHLGDTINNPARIHILAGKYLVAAAQAGSDPAVIKAGESLKASLDAFVGLYNEAYDKVSATSEARKQGKAGLSSLSSEVNAYRLLFYARATSDQRTELDSRIKAAFAYQGRNTGAAKAARVAATNTAADGKTDTPSVRRDLAATAQPPALPTIPTTVTQTIPETGEHTISASA